MYVISQKTQTVYFWLIEFMKNLLIKMYEWLKHRVKIIRRTFFAPPIPHNSEGKVYVNIGCGSDSAKEFINVDVLKFPNIHYVHDVTNLSMFPNSSVDLLYASHVVEHLPREKLFSTLGEWKRILKSGGILRISVPDLDNLITVYQAAGRDVSVIRDQVLGQAPPFDNHYTLWNDKQTRRIFSELGFINIRKWDPKTTNHHDFQDRSSYPISLNVEMEKP